MTQETILTNQVVENLQLFPDLQTNHWLYAPLNANVKSTPQLLRSDVGGRLTIETNLLTSDDVLKAVKKQIANDTPLTSDDDIQLNLSDMTVGTATISLGDGTADSEFTSLETRQHSGFSPYNVLFNLGLTAKEQEQVLAAGNGRKNFLHISYQITARHPVAIKAVLDGNVEPLVEELAQIEAVIAAEKAKEEREKRESGFFSWWRKDDDEEEDNNEDNNPQEGETTEYPEETVPPITLDDARAQIEKAIESGQLTYEKIVWGNVPPEMEADAFRNLVEKAELQLLKMAEEARQARLVHDEASLHSEQLSTDSEAVALQATIDVGEWVANSGSVNIMVSPVALPEPERTPLGDESETPEDEHGSKVEEFETVGDGELDGEETAVSPQPDPNAPPIFGIKLDHLIDKEFPVREIELKTPFGKMKFPPEALIDGVPFEEPLPPHTALDIKVRYLGTSRAYETAVTTTTEQIILQLSDLGLAEVILDGERLRQEEARRLQVKCIYDPAEDGKYERLSQTLSDRDPDWRIHWLIITQAPNLAGVLEWEYRVTPARGSGHKVGPEETKEVEIIF